MARLSVAGKIEMGGFFFSFRWRWEVVAAEVDK
jgi:hypothetical protein